MVGFVLGLLLGLIIAAIAYLIFESRKEYSGAFIIDFSDPNKDVCRLELDGGPWAVYDKKHILLRVITFGEDSQK